MTPGDWVVGYLGTAAIVIFTLFVLTAKIAHKDGFNEGREYEQNRRNTRAIAARESRLVQQPRAVEQPWPHHGHGRHSVWAQRMTVRTDTLAFAGGPATVPISHRSDSGELHALVEQTDRYIERMGLREDSHRRQLAIR